MSGKVLKSTKDENPDLQKQIGCIAGFFQLFDRHRFLTGQSTSSHSHSQNQNRPTSGGSSNESNDNKELNRTMQKATAKNPKVSREKQQFSTESSTTSMSSSSCSSSMSSLEFSRTIQTEPPSIRRIETEENLSSEGAMKQLDTPGQQSLDFYDIVKDSMHREAQGMSVTTVAKEEKKGRRTLKYIDSPRPVQSHKSVNAGVMVANEPFHILAKSTKTPWDSPRLSYDGRNIQDTFKSATKHKELPRLSLDSRGGSIRGFNDGAKPRNPSKCQQKGCERCSNTMLNQLQEPETSKGPSSVVAKLMGLEAFPDWAQTCETPLGTSSCPTNNNELLARSSTSEEYRQHRSSVSPRTCKGSTLPQSRRADSITNVTPHSQFYLESTPWRQPDASQSSQLRASKGSESAIKASNSSLSVYGEIEKRLAELEFKKSGKDLRALKQILEAMQRYKDSLDITRDQALNSPSDSRNNSSLSESSKVHSPRIRQKDPTSLTMEMSNSSQGSKLPIVIMKPAKVTRKTNNPSSTELSIHDKSGLNKCCPGNPTNGRLVDKLDKETAKGIRSTITHLKDPFSQPLGSADKSNKMRSSKLMQSSKVPQHNNGENTSNSGNITVTGSPRLQKKFGLERRSPPTSPSSDPSINKRHRNGQSMDLSSPSTSPRQKFSALQERNERFRETSRHWRDFKHHVDVISPEFDRKRSLATRSDIEVIHIDQSGNINSTSFQLNGLNQNIEVEDLSKESSTADKKVTADQPSPVSVLDAAFYREDPPSPVKKKSDISKDLGEALSAEHDSEENSADLPLLSNITKANFGNGIGDRNLNTQTLIQVLGQIDCIDEKFIHFNDIKDPDHKYISEILLASGLLCGPSSSQIFHSPGHLINPKLFLALEQLKTNKRQLDIEDSAKNSASTINPGQMQRKLIFDVVDAILVGKLILEGSTTRWCLPNKPAGRKQQGQQLFDEICSEVDKLQGKNKNVSLPTEDENLTSPLWEDMMHHSRIWTDCYSEIPNIVLDIERLVFKDLITEVVRGEVANNARRHCRQLQFPR